MFEYEFGESSPNAGFGATFTKPGTVTGLLATLGIGESVTITRLPDVFHVPVRIVTANGGLTRRTYTYTHSELLPAGTVVEVPAQRWAHGPAFGVVQGAGLVEDSATEPIVRVV